MKNIFSLSHVICTVFFCMAFMACSTDSSGISDRDGDSVADDIDNCAFISNPDQADIDGDGIGDACDPTNDLQSVLFKCENGFAGTYPCNNYDLVSHIPLSELGSPMVAGNDSWGWTDPVSGKEYALVGITSGLVFVDISDAFEPLILGTLPTETFDSPWRDVKVYNHHAFVVADGAGAHGMQVFDLTRLRDVASPPVTFTIDAHYTGINSAHNMVINEESGYAYIVGSSTFNGGPHFVNIQNPTSPVAAGGYNIDGYTHDAQVVSYNGPDTDYIGEEIFIGSNGNELVIVNVTDKANPVQISSISYSNVGYAHQGWFTEDLTYFFVGDETDELNFGINTRTLIFDLTDLDNPQFHMQYLGSTQAIDHNGYVLGNFFYLASYTAGVRILDITNVDSGTVDEVGFFDTYPDDNSTSFNGAWNVYPYFDSANIVISDLNRGLFIVRRSTN
jgi:choice-of-anchor B domain-containing protein